MTDRYDSEEKRVGLCSRCRHARRLTSAKGSVFYRCGRASDDPAYRDYPPLPVRTCPGFDTIDGDARSTTDR